MVMIMRTILTDRIRRSGSIMILLLLQLFLLLLLLLFPSRHPERKKKNTSCFDDQPPVQYHGRPDGPSQQQPFYSIGHSHLLRRSCILPNEPPTGAPWARSIDRLRHPPPPPPPHYYYFHHHHHHVPFQPDSLDQRRHPSLDHPDQFPSQ